MEIKVELASGASTDADIEIYRKTGNANKKITIEGDGASEWELGNLNLIYMNQDDTPTNKIYVKVTNQTDAGSSTIKVTLSGIEAQD